MIQLQRVSVSVDEAVLLPPTDASIARGEAVALRGENGSGKTTLLRVLAGAQRPTSGTVSVDGSPIDERSPRFRRRVASMIALPPFARDLTLHEHVMLIATTWGRDVDDASSAASSALAELGLSGLENRFPHELSSGQRQMGSLALLLVRPFDVLLLDEPEQRLDAAHLDVVIRLLGRLRADGVTVVFATHSDALASAAADRSLVLDAA
ncbi:ABC transporter ATP-binding protein [Microbacterium sp. Root61]|uniref:ABC transporter ATP-binding protein n=1 Tax=Microbacterium sp. Root61 TaxID=1736570 RepID=UPI0009EB14AD|nr:ABC transporter ATP-binding protein [Microbacterium sp. Root61]